MCVYMFTCECIYVNTKGLCCVFLSTLFLLHLFVVCVCIYHSMWKLETLSFYSVDFRDQAQVIRLSSKHPYLLTCLP